MWTLLDIAGCVFGKRGEDDGATILRRPDLQNCFPFGEIRPYLMGLFAVEQDSLNRAVIGRRAADDQLPG